jgi:putative two-component system response regulator
MIDSTDSQLRVLVVDDEPTTRITLKATVEQFGYVCDAMCSGEEALEALNNTHYSIVISDWEMPGMTGIELCQRVSKASRSGYMHFILLTSNSTPDHIVQGLEAGADDFIAKPFNPAELRVRMQIAERIGSLDTMGITIFALAKLAESRDPETGAHLDRVRMYSRVLASEMKEMGRWDEIDEEFIRLMYLTSPLHDIGKVAIPDCILLKPGQLSDEEFGIMKSHAVAGAETLAAALQLNPGNLYLTIAHDITRSHHERWDGSGYPDGLKGQDIPLCARIMAVADVYDALTSKRVYKDAMPHLVACGVIRDGSGTHFDPQLIEAFEIVAEEFARIRDENDDVEEDPQSLKLRAA